jgi:hypothetical protein
VSIALLLTSKSNPDQRELVPVAAQAIFAAKWLPACSVLKLEWVPLFETGIAVEPANVEAVVQELERLRAWMTQQTGYAHESQSLTRLIDGIEAARTNPDLEIFIG